VGEDSYPGNIEAWVDDKDKITIKYKLARCRVFKHMQILEASYGRVEYCNTDRKDGQNLPMASHCLEAEVKWDLAYSCEFASPFLLHIHLNLFNYSSHFSI
jgi:hypothetical protein